MRIALIPLLALMLLGPLSSGLHPDLSLVSMAWAEDDDDDDDGGWDSDDDDDAPTRRVTRPRPPAPAAPLPDYRPEIVVLGLLPDDLTGLLAQGFVMLEATDLVAFGARAHRLRAPDGLTLDAARALVRALPSGSAADFNHFYRGNQGAACEGAHCAGFDQVDWQPPVTPATCGPLPLVGMIDTGINAEHAALSGADLTLHRLEPVDGAASAALHGTAVASLLVGNAASRTPGLVPDLPLIAVDAFSRAGGDERTDAFTLLRSLDLLAEAGVRVANLSLAGPENVALTEAMTLLVTDRLMVIVAAAGNNGPHAAPAWPAAHPGVIAVTAVDRGGRIYRRAGQGAHIDLAAPGVEVWAAASVSGGRSKTGTSFAAPFVTAAVARLLQSRPDLAPADVAAWLAREAQDLGEPGQDPVFGHGLLRFPAPDC